MARRKIKKSAMKIQSRRKKRGSHKVSVKAIKLARALKKMKSVAKKTMQKCLKGVPSIRQSLYKKVDVAVAKNIHAAVEEAVISAVNVTLEKKKVKTPKERKPRVKKERKPRVKKVKAEKAVKAEAVA